MSICEEEAVCATKEGPHKWAFVAKVYAILSLELLITVNISSAIYFLKPVARFFSQSRVGLVLYIAICVFTLIAFIIMLYANKFHPLNLILLVIYTLLQGFTLGIACAFTKGVIIFEAAILTALVVVSLTLFAFWASFRGYDFSLCGPVLFVFLGLVVEFALIQIFIPFGKLAEMIFSEISALLFVAYVVYDTYNLIKVYHEYDEYIVASIAIYLDFLNLFLDSFRYLKDCISKIQKKRMKYCNSGITSNVGNRRASGYWGDCGGPNCGNCRDCCDCGDCDCNCDCGGCDCSDCL